MKETLGALYFLNQGKRKPLSCLKSFPALMSSAQPVAMLPQTAKVMHEGTNKERRVCDLCYYDGIQ